jgi:DNA helicase-2/ATP-dependent DNA helicase PcrA
LFQSFNDEVSLERIINEPKRNIGEMTLAKWIGFAKENSLDLINAGLKFGQVEKISSARIDAVINFCEFVKRMSELEEKLSLTDFIQKVFSESGYERYLSDGTEEGEMKLENVRELLTVAKKYEEYEGEPASTREDDSSTRGGEGLRLFLEEVALVSDTDNIDQGIDSVHLMTLHSAKGLEFKVVFIAGLEEGILPHSRSMLSETEMEEERRLMYVGITRAKEKVYLLFVSERNIYGSTQINPPSRFLDDIPEHLINNFQTQNISCAHAPVFGQRAGQSEAEIKNSFKDGDKVFHEIFGDGIVVAVQGDIVTVAFSKAGLKMLSSSIAPLIKK